VTRVESAMSGREATAGRGDRELSSGVSVEKLLAGSGQEIGEKKELSGHERSRSEDALVCNG